MAKKGIPVTLPSLKRAAWPVLAAVLVGLGGPSTAGDPCGDAGGARPRSPAARRSTREREGTLTYKDPRLGDRVPSRSWELYLQDNPKVDPVRQGPLRDPKRNAEYPYRLQVHCRKGEFDSDLRFVVHFVKREDEALAQRVGGVLARLYWIGWDYLGRRPSETGYTNVWLTHDGEAGAEEYEGHIYLFAVGEARAPAEWVRELAHEYSHIILPEAGPYTDPEPWANGYLGERLLMKWLLFDNQQLHVWDRPINGAAYVANQVTPLRNRFLNEGPAAPASRKTDRDGMYFFIGQVLALEGAHGPAVLRQLLKEFVTPRPQNLAGYFARALRQMQPPTLPLDPAAYIPARSEPVASGTDGAGQRFRKASYWLLLPGGEWRLELEGVIPAGLGVRLDAAELTRVSSTSVSVMAWDTKLASPNAVWRRLELTAPPESVVEIKAIRITGR
jgi:hypothetical protein